MKHRDNRALNVTQNPTRLQKPGPSKPQNKVDRILIQLFC
jgi:hypothetical protein